MRSITMRRISCLIVFSFVLLTIAAKDRRGELQPRNPTSARKVSGPTESGGADQELATLDCKMHSDCNAHEKSCYCDNLCSMYDDCCMLNAPSQKERHSFIPDLSQYMSCKSWRTVHIWVVTKCPLESSETCSSEGQDIHSLSNVPVTDENNITYSNHLCAQCHGVSKYSYWTFLIAHGNTQHSPCNASTNIVCDDFENSTEICINTLLKKECDVITFPPKGTSIRYCIDTDAITNNMSCNAEHLPILNKKVWKLYKNVHCCAKLEGECTENEYSCWRRPQFITTDIDSMRSPTGYPSYTVFSFVKGCNDVSACGDVKYHGIKFEFDVLFKYKTKTPNVYDGVPLVCLLTKYFKEMEDELSVLDGEMEMWKGSAAHPYSIFVLNLRLESRFIFSRKKDIDILKYHLGKMTLSVYVKEKGNMFIMENVGDEATEYNVSGLQKEEARIRNRFVIDWFSGMNNDVCESVQDLNTWDIPFLRCKHLNISVNIDGMDLNIEYKCLRFSTLKTPRDMTYAPTGGVDAQPLDRHILCLLLTTVSLAMIFLI